MTCFIDSNLSHRLATFTLKLFNILNACGCPHGGRGRSHVDACGHGRGRSKPDFLVDVI